jgi:hypothetical protein
VKPCLALALALLAAACGKPAAAKPPAPPDAHPAASVAREPMMDNRGPPPIRFPDAKGMARVGRVDPRPPADLADTLEHVVAPKLERCYGEELRRTDPTLAGHVQMKVYVGADGKITGADATYDANPSIEACAVNSVDAAHQAPGDKVYQVTIQLTPSAR